MEVIDFTFSRIFQCTCFEQVFQNGCISFDLPDSPLSKLLRIYSCVDLASSLASQCGASFFFDPLHVLWFVSNSLLRNSTYSKSAMLWCSFLCVFSVKWSPPCPSFLSCQNQAREKNESSLLCPCLTFPKTQLFFTFNVESILCISLRRPLESHS
jgi:hypothetical protein